MTKISFIEGAILPIDKPLNWTSFDVVKKIRYEIINPVSYTHLTLPTT